MKTPKSALFIALLIIIAAAPGCNLINRATVAQTEKKSTAADQKRWESPKVIARITDPAIIESSGIIVSRQNEEIFWTHNDSGSDAFIYAFDRQGKKRGVWKLNGAKNTDWEDIAAYTAPQNGADYLFLGDIGDNESRRKELQIYIVREPKVEPDNANSDKKNSLLTENATILQLKYPDGNHDAETLLVNPQTGDVYIITKEITKPAGVYRLRAPFTADKINVLEKIAQITVPSIPNGLLTGGDISADGRRVILCDYFGAYELILPANAKNFDEIWREKPQLIELGERKQGEGIAYSLDGNTIYATSEKKNSPLIEVKRK